jgi:hypothetical protein
MRGLPLLHQSQSRTSHLAEPARHWTNALESLQSWPMHAHPNYPKTHPPPRSSSECPVVGRN